MTNRERNIKLFIGNLPFDTTDEDLRGLLRGCGNIRYAGIRREAHTNRSKGYGHVEYRTEAECVEAIKRLAGTEIKGRLVKIDFCEDYYRDKYADLLMTTLRPKVDHMASSIHPPPENVAPPTMEHIYHQGLSALQYGIPIPQPNIPVVQGGMGMNQSNIAPVMPQSGIPIMQPGLAMMQATMSQIGQPTMGLGQQSVILQPPGMAQTSLVGVPPMPPTQGARVPLEGMGMGHPSTSPMNQNQVAMGQMVSNPVQVPINHQLAQQVPQHMKVSISQNINPQTNQQIKGVGPQTIRSSSMNKNMPQDTLEYHKSDQKRIRIEEELLLDNGKIVSKELYYLIKKMSMMDVYNLVKKIDYLMGKSPNTAKSILNANTSMRSALIHAKLLLGYKDFSYKNFKDVDVSNILDYFVIH